MKLEILLSTMILEMLKKLTMGSKDKDSYEWG